MYKTIYYAGDYKLLPIIRHFRSPPAK